MERSGFFDAYKVGEQYDRVYLAESFAQYFANFISDGVFGGKSEELQVVAMFEPKMQVSVNKGKGWIKGYWYENSEDLYLPLDVADGVLSRIDSIVVRLDYEGRLINLAVIKGAPSLNPSPAPILRNADCHDLKLAEVFVKAGAVNITQADITDTRLDNEVCGIVHSLIDQVDTSTLFEQYLSWYKQTTNQAIKDMDEFKKNFESDLMAWYESIKDILDENVAINLQNQIDELKFKKADKNDVYTKKETDEKLKEKAENSVVVSLTNKVDLTRTYTLSHNRAEATIIKGLTSDVGIGEKSPDNPYVLSGVETNGVTLYSLSNGVCDEYNSQTGVLTKRVGKVVLNGSEDWRETVDSKGDKYFNFTIGNNKKTTVLTNMYLYIVSWDKAEIIKSCFLGGGDANILVIKDTTKTLEAFERMLAKKNLVVLYELATPETTQLTPKPTYQHTLTSLPTGQGIYQCQFIATADYTEGDTFTGYTAKPQGEETILPDKAFVKGDIVSITVDTVGKKLGFDVSSRIDNTISTYQYSKSGTTHNLTGRGNNIQFIPSSDFVSGNTIKVNGVTVTPVDNLGETLDEPFKANIVQNVTLQGNKLVFKLGGGGGALKPKIYVQTSQPPTSTSKEGEFWINASGFSINKIVADTKQPTSMPENTLFVLTAFKENSYKLINTKNYVIGTWVQFAQLWLNGWWRDNEVYIFNGSQWVNISQKSDRLFHSDGRASLYELDINTLTPIKTVSSPSNSPYDIGGIQNRLYHCDDDTSKIYELDIDTLLPIKTVSSLGIYPRGIGGIQNRLYHCDTNTSKIYELDVNTLLPIKTVSSLGSFPIGIGGIQNRLYHCDNGTKKLYELDINTLTPIKTVSRPRSSPRGIGGIQNRLYHCDNDTSKIYELDVNTLLPIKTVSSPHSSPRGIGGTK